MKKRHLVYFCLTAAITVAILLCMAGMKAIFDPEPNGCDMTYMFEYPEYIRIKLKKKITKKYPRYALYLYGEGSYAQEQRRALSPTGIPVLFIPGNAGSYRQVRSLASIALRKAERHRNHFNYFTIDFDEDFSGLYGGVLMDQVHFVHMCLRHITRLYERKTSSRKSVILIGHSMGGMIARALFLQDNFEPKFVPIIITLGTPHVAPVVPFDNKLNSFYSRVNNFWKTSSSIANISVISLAGGSRDILVPAKYCSLPHNAHVALQYSEVTTSIPDVWLTIDHLALCWCKQLILVINRALFALIDQDANMISNDHIKQVQVLQQYFGVVNKQNEEMVSESRIGQPARIYNKTNIWNNFAMISFFGSLLIPVNASKDNVQFVALTNTVDDISIMSCEHVEVDTCTNGKMIPLEVLPKSSKEKAGFVHLTILKNTSYIKMTSLKDKQQLIMQVFPGSDTQNEFNNFGLFSGVQRFLSSNFMFINISLPMISNCFDVYLIIVEKVKCTSDDDGLFIGRIHLPWSHEDVYAIPTESYQFSILLKTHSSKPTTVSNVAQLHVWKTDDCSLEVSIQYQFVQTVGRLFVLYAPLIPQWIYSWIMVVLIIQIRQIPDKEPILSIWSVMTSRSQSLLILLFLLLCNELLLKSLFGEGISQSHVVDGRIFHDWALPTCFIILTAFVIFLAMYIFLEIMLSIMVWVVLLSPLKHIQIQNQTSMTVMVLSYTSLVLFLSFLMCLCSSVAIYFLVIINLIHCCNLTLKSRLSTVSSVDKLEVISKLHLSKLLLIFYFLVSFQTTPAFIVWLKILPTSWFLISDPFCTFVLLVIPTVVCFLAMHVRKPDSYAAYIILFVWCVGYLLFSLDMFPNVLGVILLAVDFFVFKKEKHEKVT